jgi:DNA-binding SARP family transcriptional activator
MALLRIQLLGAVRVFHADHTYDARLTHTLQPLLAWLVLNRKKTHAREALTELFWGDQREDRARRCLSTALWRLKQALEPDGVEPGAYLVSTAATVGFNNDSDHWLDVAAFEEGVGLLRTLGHRTGSAQDWLRAEAAIAHYTGDLLEGFYDDWAIRERERLRLLYLDSLAALLAHYSQVGAHDDALRCGQQILALDPLREDIHRELIRLHLQRSHRALALHQYEQCRALLEDELGVEPMEETRALCAALLPANAARPRSTLPHKAAAPAVGKAAAVRSGIAVSLRAAAARLDEARKAILDALRAAESDSDRS